MTEIEFHSGVDADRGLVLGESFGGKTYLVRKIARPFRRVLVVTPQYHEWKDYPNRVATMNADVAYGAIAKALDEGNMLVIIDDSDILLEKLVKNVNFQYFVKGARHRGVAWIIITRRTADIPTMIPKQANKWFVFQTDLPRDVEFLNEYAYPAGDEVKDLDRNAHEFLYIDRDAKTRTRMIA